MYILHTVYRRKANWIGHILRRNCLIKHVVEGKVEGRIEVPVRRGRKPRKLLDDIKEKKGYCIFNEEALFCPLRRTSIGKGYIAVIRQTKE